MAARISDTLSGRFLGVGWSSTFAKWSCSPFMNHERTTLPERDVVQNAVVVLAAHEGFEPIISTDFTS